MGNTLCPWGRAVTSPLSSRRAPGALCPGCSNPLGALHSLLPVALAALSPARGRFLIEEIQVMLPRAHLWHLPRGANPPSHAARPLLPPRAKPRLPRCCVYTVLNRKRKLLSEKQNRAKELCFPAPRVLGFAVLALFLLTAVGCRRAPGPPAGERLEAGKGELPWEHASEGCQAGEGRGFGANKAHTSTGKFLQGVLRLGEQQICTDLAVLEP